MILVPYGAIFPKVLTHKDCGGYVERVPFVPGWFSCPSCNTLLHGNNVEQSELPVVA